MYCPQDILNGDTVVGSLNIDDMRIASKFSSLSDSISGYTAEVETASFLSFAYW